MPTEEVVLRLRALLLSSQRLSQASGGFALRSLRGSVISNIAEVFDPGASGAARVAKLSFRLRERLGEDSQLQVAGIGEVKSLEPWQEEVGTKSVVWAGLSRLSLQFAVDSGNLFTRSLPYWLSKSTKYMTGGLGLAPVHAIVVLVDLFNELPMTKSECLRQNRCITARPHPRTNAWCKGCRGSWSKCGQIFGNTTRMSNNWLPYRSLKSLVLVGGSSLSWGQSRPVLTTTAFLKESTFIPRSFIRTFSRLHSPPKSSKGIRVAATKRHGLIGGLLGCKFYGWPAISWPAVWLRDMPVVPSSFHKLSCTQKFFLTEKSEKFFITFRRLVLLHLPKWLVEAAVAFLQLQNSILRTTYAVENGRMKQHVHSTLFDVLEYVEVGSETEDQMEERGQMFAEASMDLHNEPPFRVLCAHASGSDGPTLLVIKVHHLAADGRSMNHLDKQLLRFLEWGMQSFDGEPQHLASLTMMPKLKPLLYDRSCRCIAARLPKWGQIPPQFSDYVSWVERYRQSEEFQQDLRYWRLQLENAPARTAHVNHEAGAATGRSMPAVVEANFPLNFPGDLTQQCSGSAFPVVMASLAATLCLLSQQDVVVIGSPVFGTPLGFAEVVGCLAHIVPYVIRMPAPFSVPEFLTSVHSKVEAAREHCILPVEEVLSSPTIESLQFSAILTWQPPGSWSRERFSKNSRAWGDQKFIGPSPLLANLVLDAYQTGFNSRDKCVGSLAINPKCFDIETAKDISKTLAIVASKMENCLGSEFVNFRAWCQGVFNPCEVPGP